VCLIYKTTEGVLPRLGSTPSVLFENKRQFRYLGGVNLSKNTRKMDSYIKEISPIDSQVRTLFALLDAHNLSHCPPEICHLTQPEDLLKIDFTLMGVFCDDQLVGMGGLKYFEDYAEVTRMFVRDEYRGKGLSKIVLEELEKQAIKKEKAILKLETNANFENALHLYQKSGFSECGPFGDYQIMPPNMYFEKKLESTL
jgi:putative acetyltransferase